MPRAGTGFWRKLWDGPKHLSGATQEDMAGMLRRAINSGTGHAAMLPIANFGKTGTTQDSRDALFVGFAGDLVVGVWVGRDDNSPLGRISGGTVPARIWRDFMIRALGIKQAAPSPPARDPDIVDQPNLPQAPGDVILGPDGATIMLPGGEVRIDRDGVGIAGPDYEEVRERIDEAGQRAEERYERARERIEEGRVAEPN